MLYGKPALYKNSVVQSPFPRLGIPNRAATSVAFRTIAALCLSGKLAASTRHPGTVYAPCAAFAATVDFPHCSEQFKIPASP